MDVEDICDLLLSVHFSFFRVWFLISVPSPALPPASLLGLSPPHPLLPHVPTPTLVPLSQMFRANQSLS